MDRKKAADLAYAEGYRLGAASRDAEIQRLQFALADSEALELGTAEHCDQLRAEINKLRESTELLLIARQIGHYRDEWDMLKEALAATEPKITKPI